MNLGLSKVDWVIKLATNKRNNVSPYRESKSKIITSQTKPVAIAVIATAALPASFACFAAGLCLMLISSTMRSIAVLRHSAANIKIPPASIIACWVKVIGKKKVKEPEMIFAIIHCHKLPSVLATW